MGVLMALYLMLSVVYFTGPHPNTLVECLPSAKCDTHLGQVCVLERNELDHLFFRVEGREGTFRIPLALTESTDPVRDAEANIAQHMQPGVRVGCSPCRAPFSAPRSDSTSTQPPPSSLSLVSSSAFFESTFCSWVWVCFCCWLDTH